MIPEWKWLAWHLYAHDLGIDPPHLDDAIAGCWTEFDTNGREFNAGAEGVAKFGARARELVTVRDAMESYKQLAGDGNGEV